MIKLNSKKKVFKDFFQIDKYNISFDIENGNKNIERLCFERGDSVAVFAYDVVKDLVLLVSEFRTGAYARALRSDFSEENIKHYSFSLSLVAGMLDKGLSEIDTAKEEGVEEAGVKFSNFEEIYKQPLLVSPGGTSEAVKMLYAEFDSEKIDLDKTFGVESEGESIKAKLVSPEQLNDMILDQDIADMKTVLAFNWFQINKMTK